MRTLFAGLATLALGLATCLNASAQAENRNRDENRDQNAARGQGERKVIRGVIAGVTVEGEMAIDYRTNRAATAEMSYLTIVGSERPQGRSRDGGDVARDRDRGDRNEREAARDREGDRNERETARDRDREDRNDRDRQASSDGQRQNIYVVWLTPRTEIRKIGDRRANRDRDRDRDEQNANRNDRDRNERNANQRNQNENANRGGDADSLALDALEVGDRVEVRFLQRSAASDNPNAVSRKHGRHRTYYGEALAITILSEPGQADRDRDNDRNRDNARDRDSDRQPNRDRDRDRDRDQNKRDNDRDN